LARNAEQNALPRDRRGIDGLGLLSTVYRVGNVAPSLCGHEVIKRVGCFCPLARNLGRSRTMLVH
jgi:hypothetical protein